METSAVIGASPKPDRYSNKAIRMLTEYGHTPIPVAPNHETIEGLPVYPSLDLIPEKIDTVTIYLGPARQGSIVNDIIAIAPKRVIFNPDMHSAGHWHNIFNTFKHLQNSMSILLIF